MQEAQQQYLEDLSAAQINANRQVLHLISLKTTQREELRDAALISIALNLAVLAESSFSNPDPDEEPGENQ